MVKYIHKFVLSKYSNLQNKCAKMLYFRKFDVSYKVMESL